MNFGKWMAGLGHKDPTREWPTCCISTLEFDTATGQLSGIALDSPIDSAQALGPADQCSGGAIPEIDYRALGLQMSCFEGTLVHFRVIVAPAGRSNDRDRAFQPGEVMVRAGGRSVPLNGRTTERDVIAQFGEPIETGPVANDRVHTFLVDRCMIDTYHDPETGALVEVELGLRGTEDLSDSSQMAGGA